MKFSKATWSLIVILIAMMLIFIAAAYAQDVTQPPVVKTGSTIHETDIRNGEVMYVSGNAFVARLETGKFELFTVKPDFLFHVDSRHVTISDLKPGMKLTQLVTTETVPKEVITVRTVKGKVWYQSADRLILEYPDGEHKQFKVPQGVIFNIDGQPKTVYDLRKGMEITATVVRTAPEEHIAKEHEYYMRPTEAVPTEGPMLVETPKIAQAPLVTAEAREPMPEQLPATASLLPWVAIVGTILLAVAIAALMTRKSHA